MKSLAWDFKQPNRSAVEAIAAAGGIEPLVAQVVALLRDGDVEGKASAAGVLAKLADGNAANQQAIRAGGAIVPLVALVRDGFVVGKAYAAYALATLADGNAANQAAIRAAGGIQPLVALVRDDDVAGKTNAAAALQNFPN